MAIHFSININTEDKKVTKNLNENMSLMKSIMFVKLNGAFYSANSIKLGTIKLKDKLLCGW